MIIDSGVITGSLVVSGSYNQTGSAVINGDLTVTGVLNATISGSATSASYAATASVAISASYAATASVAPSYLLTSSFNTFSGSASTRLVGLEATASTLTSASASFASSINSLQGKTGSYATTASNTFYGNQTITGDIILSGSSQIQGRGDTTNMLFGMFDGSSIFGPYYQVFGNNYADTTQRGSAEFVYDNRNSGGSGFNIASYNGATWIRKFRVDDNGVQITGSLKVTGGASGSFSGSFQGNGSGLTNVPASGIVGLQLNQIGSGSVTASIAPDLGFRVNTNSQITGSLIVTNGITGSFSGSLYNLQNTTLGHIPFFSQSQILVDSAILQVDNGLDQGYSIAINQNGVDTNNPEALFVYQASTSSFNVVSGKGNLNNYLQLNIQNLNNGANASSDVVATANNGNENTNFIDMGINGANFSGPIGAANDAYIYSTGENLHIGNASSGGQHLGFFVGGDDVVADNKLQLNPGNLHELTGSLNASAGFTGSLQGNAATATSASYAATASFGADFTASNALINNTLTAQTLIVQTITSSIQYSSGSNIFGNLLTNTQQLTGSVTITGSLAVNESNVILTNQTSSMSVLSSSYAVSASHALISDNAITASYAIQAATASSADQFNVRTALTASGLIYPTTDGVFAGQVLQTNAAGTLSFGNVAAVFEDVYNGEATQLTKGTPLYVSGAVGATPKVYRANTSDPTKMPVTFLAMENIASGAVGRGITLGLITGIDLTGYPVGTQLWVDGIGALTSVRPTGSSDIVQPIGIVTKTGNGGQLNVLNPGPVLLPNIAQGYTWVGNTNNEPVAVATSSIQNVVSSSYASNAELFDNRDSLTFANTASNTFTGPQYVSDASNAASFVSTASLYTDGGLRVTKDAYVSGTIYVNNLTVYGTSSVAYTTSSQVNIGANLLTLNTDTPAIRFGGIAVFDSGSTGVSGSFLWDSEKNHWIYTQPSGSGYTSGMAMFGPRNTGSLGDEQGTGFNRVMKGQGGDHITSSQIIDDGSTVSISGSLTVTGSITGTLYGTSSWATNAEVAPYYVLTSSYNLDSASFSTRTTNLETTASGLTNASASFSIRVTDNELTGSSLVAASASFSTRVTNTEATASSLVAASASFEANYVKNSQTSSMTVLSASYALTASAANIFTANQITASNITVTGTVTAQTLNVQQVTSSIVYSSGSNQFGSLLTDVQQFTGSVTITGSLQVNGRTPLYIDQTSSLSVTSASYAATASTANSTATVPFIVGGTATYYGTVNSSNVGSNNVFTLNTGSYTAAKFLYTVTNGSNARTGEILAVWNDITATAVYSDVSTIDIGNTSDVTASVSIVSSQVQLNFQTNSSFWKIKSQGTLI